MTSPPTLASRAFESDMTPFGVDRMATPKPDGEVLFNRTHYGVRVMLMIGEERRGLTAEQRTLCDQLVRIPMQDDGVLRRSLHRRLPSLGRRYTTGEMRSHGRAGRRLTKK